MPILTLPAFVAAFMITPETSTCMARRLSSVTMQQPGSEVDPASIDWDKRTWSKTDDGACFMVAEDESPDPSKQWYVRASILIE